MSSSNAKVDDSSSSSYNSSSNGNGTNNNNNNDSINPACAPCVRMLRQILATTAETRPRQLLNALSPQQLHWRPTPDGLEVKIPTAAPVPQRRWTRLLYDKDPPPTLQATSARSQEESNTTSSTQSSSSSSSTEPYEWMQITCRTCANTGPEAGARAFVMGPTPMSMVICTNRNDNAGQGPRRAEMEEILTHELIHVYDVRRLALDLRDCESLAYSEIRAARHAECQGSWVPQSCTAGMAQKATLNLFPQQGRTCLRSVWERAYRDTRPFGPVRASEPSSTTTTSSSR